jgi:hypothetical protein
MGIKAWWLVRRAAVERSGNAAAEPATLRRLSSPRCNRGTSEIDQTELLPAAVGEALFHGGPCQRIKLCNFHTQEPQIHVCRKKTRWAIADWIFRQPGR